MKSLDRCMEVMELVNVNKLRGRIAECGMTQRTLAKEIGICAATMYGKMRNGTFGVDEVKAISTILSLTPEEICEIFFA